jgi:hypothetical protein
MVDDGDISGSITSTTTNTLQLDQARIRIEWSGSSVSGEYFVDTRSKDDEDFQPLDFGAQILATTDSGFHDVILKEMPFGEMQVRYVPAAGTGTVDVTLTMKTVGA